MPVSHKKQARNSIVSLQRGDIKGGGVVEGILLEENGLVEVNLQFLSNFVPSKSQYSENTFKRRALGKK